MWECPDQEVMMNSSALAFSINEAAKRIGVCRSQLYVELRNGLPSCKIGRRRVVREVDLVAWLATKLTTGTGAASGATEAH